mmetsp:Transcript_14936/g.27590  ORF Transcript_14936/g.27590 Transcript_14936/m.27590 type:complete len:222 (-) Transcript_14936:45-710(-)
MSALYRSYEQDFIKYLNSVKRRLSLVNTLPKDEKELAVREALLDVSEADKCLRRMEIEIHVLPSEKRKKMQSEISSHREDLHSKKLQLKTEEKTFDSSKSKSALLGKGTSVSSIQNYGSIGDRNLRGTELLADQNSRLETSRRAAIESEGIAISALQGLKTQRDQMTRMSHNAKNINEDISGSNKLLSGMQRAAFSNKLAMIGIVCLLAVLIVLVVYFKVR